MEEMDDAGYSAEEGFIYRTYGKADGLERYVRFERRCGLWYRVELAINRPLLCGLAKGMGVKGKRKAAEVSERNIGTIITNGDKRDITLLEGGFHYLLGIYSYCSSKKALRRKDYRQFGDWIRQAWNRQ